MDLDNVTERLGTLTVAGPRARQLMARLCHQDTSGSEDNYNYIPGVLKRAD